MEAEFEGKCLKCNKNPYVLTTLFFTIKVTEIKISTPYFNSLGENTRTQSRPTKWYFSFFFDEFRRMAFDGEYAKYLYLPIIEVDEFISSLKETYIFQKNCGWFFLNEFKSVKESCAHVHFKKWNVKWLGALVWHLLPYIKNYWLSYLGSSTYVLCQYLPKTDLIFVQSGTLKCDPSN